MYCQYVLSLCNGFIHIFLRCIIVIDADSNFKFIVMLIHDFIDILDCIRTRFNRCIIGNNIVYLISISID